LGKAFPQPRVPLRTDLQRFTLLMSESQSNCQRVVERNASSRRLLLVTLSARTPFRLALPAVRLWLDAPMLSNTFWGLTDPPESHGDIFRATPVQPTSSIKVLDSSVALPGVECGDAEALGPSKPAWTVMLTFVGYSRPNPWNYRFAVWGVSSAGRTDFLKTVFNRMYTPVDCRDGSEDVCVVSATRSTRSSRGPDSRLPFLRCSLSSYSDRPAVTSGTRS
jgi:hypothetical protein